MGEDTTTGERDSDTNVKTTASGEVSGEIDKACSIEDKQADLSEDTDVGVKKVVLSDTESDGLKQCSDLPVVEPSKIFAEVSEDHEDSGNQTTNGETGAGSTTESEQPELIKDSSEVFTLRKTLWRDSVVAFLCQSQNGPCPLLALCNLLILRGSLVINPDAEVVTVEYLLQLLGDLLMNATPEDNRPEIMLNHEHNLGACFAILPKLQTGLDVNVRFTGIDQMEYTGDTIIFDLLRVDLLHGWLVDPTDTETCAAIGNASYNKLVELVVAYHEVTGLGTKTSLENLKDTTTVQTGMTIANFLDETASQLTPYGIQQLRSRLKNGDLAIFFRNNHFSTISKHGDEVFLLVTDQGYCGTTIVWEMLNDVNGSGAMYDSEFKVFKPKVPDAEIAPGADTAIVNKPSTEDEELAEAMRLSLQDSGLSAASSENNTTGDDTRELTREESDHLLAVSLSQQLSNESAPLTKEQREDADRQYALRLAEGVSPEPVQHSEDSDRAMALKLQAQEDEEASRRQSTSTNSTQRPRTNPTTTPRDRKSEDKDSCCVS